MSDRLAYSGSFRVNVSLMAAIVFSRRSALALSKSKYSELAALSVEMGKRRFYGKQQIVRYGESRRQQLLSREYGKMFESSQLRADFRHLDNTR